MQKLERFAAICFFFLSFQLQAESFRTIAAATIEVNHDRPSGSVSPMGINESVFISLGTGARFLKGIELELTAPQAWLSYRGSLVMTVYNEINQPPSIGIVDLEASRVAYDPLPGKIQIVYQIPIRNSHGLRTSPYATVLADVAPPASFPILFRLIPVIKGMSAELENMIFNLTVRPILSDEGAVRLVPRYPPQLRSKPFTVLINDVVISNPHEEQILKEGMHHLVILSEDYRNESRRFVIERAKVLDLVVDLKDPTPFITFEGPENAMIFLDNAPVTRGSIPVEPGLREAKFQIGDYTIIRTINVQRGKTYRVSMNIDLTINESD